MTMKKLDLKTKYKALYQPSAKTPVILQVPDFLFVRIDGAIEKGFEPGNSPQFQHAVEAMYGFAYTLKFASKQRKQNPIDYPVMALEGLWWVEDGNFDITIKLFSLTIPLRRVIMFAFTKNARMHTSFR